MRLRYANIPPEKQATHSQVLQDVLVLSLMQGKMNGTYVEIGANDPEFINNTFVLSKYFGWTGVSIEYDPIYKPKWQQARPNDKYVEADAITLDYRSLFNETFKGQKTIDYLQCDIDPSINTFKALQQVPHDEYRFGIITFETDLYTGGESARIREESRQYLTNLGYTLLVGDILVGGNNPFEDWYVDMNLVDQHTAKCIQEMGKLTQLPVNLLFM